LLDDDDAARQRLARFPLGRYAPPEEVARTYVFLASADSDYMTGSVIRIDGGLAI
jgi:3-oxoacyl-[acyl-carrier protein] reductase